MKYDLMGRPQTMCHKMKYDLMGRPDQLSIKVIRDNAIYQLTKFEAVWYFTKYDDGLGKKVGIIYGCKSTDDMDNYFRPVKWIILERKDDKVSFDIMTKYIREQGTKFYTNDADNSDSNVWGYYYSKDCDINFEPLDMATTPDLGHTYLFYMDKETRTYKEL